MAYFFHTFKLFILLIYTSNVPSTTTWPTVINGPDCDALHSLIMLSCYNIDASSIDVVRKSLANVISWPQIHAVFSKSDIRSLPSDLFANSKLTTLVFTLRCTFDGFPNNILRNVNTDLKRLQFSAVEGINSLSSSDFTGLPFVDSLQFFSFESNVSMEIMDFTFASLVNLRHLALRQTLLNAIPESVFYGLSSLNELDLSANLLTTLPKNVLSQVEHLTTLWLNDNELHSLDDGLFDGLDELQFVSVMGNPFNCSCNLQWFKSWLQEKQLLEESGARCKYPIDISFDKFDFCHTNSPVVFDKQHL